MTVNRESEGNKKKDGTSPTYPRLLHFFFLKHRPLKSRRKRKLRDQEKGDKKTLVLRQ